MSTRVHAGEYTSANSSSPWKSQKKSSFLSLRREHRSPERSFPAAGGIRSHAEKSMSPSSFHASQDATRPVISRPQDLAGHHHNRRPSKTPSLRHEQSFPPSSRSREQEECEREDSAQGNFFDFPVVDERLTRSKGGESTKARSRARSGPTKRSEHSRDSGGPYPYPVRDSNSSTLSHLEDTPQTPIDDAFLRDPIFGVAPVVVAAPIAGVETMDALVDGMNGFGSDDHFWRSYSKKSAYW